MVLAKLRRLIPALLAFAASGAFAGNITYISSASGYMLYNAGGGAVTANWQGQPPLGGFTGYGQIHLNGQCLTGKAASQQLRWEACRGGDKSQVWALANRRLNNEAGWCADVEGNRAGAGVRVLAYKCSGAINQQWNAHTAVAAQTAAARISNAAVRTEFLRNAQSARPGAVISLATGKVIAAGGGNVIAAGGGNVIAAGGGNVIAAGGGN